VAVLTADQFIGMNGEAVRFVHPAGFSRRFNPAGRVKERTE